MSVRRFGKRGKKPPVLVPCEEHEWPELAWVVFNTFKTSGENKWMCPGCFGDLQVDSTGVVCGTCRRTLNAMAS